MKWRGKWETEGQSRLAKALKNIGILPGFQTALGQGGTIFRKRSQGNLSAAPTGLGKETTASERRQMGHSHPVAGLGLRSEAPTWRSVPTPRFGYKRATKACLPDKQGFWPLAT